MSVNSQYPNPWIGHSQWRTLISLEGEILSKVTATSTRNSSSALDTSWPIHQSDRVFNLYTIPKLEAAVVFLAGQTFLINTPKGVFQSLSTKTKTPPSQIVLLSWEDQYIDGLLEYCYAYAQFSKVAHLEIYTANWAWDAIKERAWNQLITKEATSEQYCPYQFFLQSIASDTQNEKERVASNFQIIPKLFKKNAHHQLFPQIEWWLKYSLAKSPCLQVQFRLFDSYFTITDQQPYPTQSYQQQVLVPIMQQYPALVNDLQRVINLRLGDLIRFKEVEKSKGGAKFNLYPSFYNYNLFSKALYKVGQEANKSQKCLRVVDILPKQLKNNDFELKEIAAKYCQEVPLLRLKSAKAHSWKTLSTIVAKAKIKKASHPSQIFLAISCGGISSISNGHIAPETRVSINRMNLSLLGFKVYELLKDQNLPQPIFQKKLILLVSPWTEANVRREMSHLLWEFGNEFETVLQPEDIIYLRQTVVPRCMEQAGQLHYYQQDSFQFSPAGHFDFIKALVDENSNIEDLLYPLEKGGKKSIGPTLIYHTIFKNLGRNINHKVSLLADYLQTESSPTFLFELVQQDGEKGVGSYWVTSKEQPAGKTKQWLTKPVYLGKNSLERVQKINGVAHPNKLPIEQKDKQPELLMSTASFMVNLDKLKKASTDFQQLPFYATQKLPLSSTFRANNANVHQGFLKTVQFERDIDQITKYIHCEGVEIELDAQGIASRFIPIKEEKDLYQNKVKILEKIWTGECKEDKAFKTALPSHTPFLLEPNEKHDTWGGHRIRDAKVLPEIDEKVSETWEASLHHKGVSGIKFDALNSVPLSTFLKDADLDIMFKILDCNSWLSIQLHPSHQTCQALTQHLESIEAEFTAANWSSDTLKEILEALSNREDDFGKEEIFYIVDNKNYKTDDEKNDPNLVLGLHQEKLEKLNFISELEWKAYSALFQTDRLFDNNLLTKFKREKIEKSAFWKLTTFVNTPSLELSEKYTAHFSKLVDQHLPFILRFRAETMATSLLSLRGILFIFSIESLKEALQTLDAAALKIAFIHSELPLFDFFYKLCPKPGSILQVKPGLIHALGKGLFAVEASNRSNNTFRIFDHGRELTATPRPLHYLLASVSLSKDSFVSKKNEHQYVFPHDSFVSKDNIHLEVFHANQLRQAQRVLFPENQGLLMLCTKGISSIKTTYKHMKTGISNTTILDLKEAYTAYIPPTNQQFERIVTVESNGYAEAECVAVAAIASRKSISNSIPKKETFKPVIAPFKNWPFEEVESIRAVQTS